MSDIVHRLKEAGVSIGSRKILFEKKYNIEEGDIVKIRLSRLNKVFERFKHNTGIVTSVDEFQETCWVEWTDELAKEGLQRKFTFDDLFRVKKQ